MVQEFGLTKDSLEYEMIYRQNLFIILSILFTENEKVEA